MRITNICEKSDGVHTAQVLGTSCGVNIHDKEDIHRTRYQRQGDAGERLGEMTHDGDFRTTWQFGNYLVQVVCLHVTVLFTRQDQDFGTVM
jgi:hypothetical protein